MMYYYPYWGMNVGWWAFWGVALVLLFGFAVPIPRSKWRQLADASPFALLQRRYAAGEITTLEYEERKAILERDRLLGTNANEPKAGPRPPMDPTPRGA